MNPVGDANSTAGEYQMQGVRNPMAQLRVHMQGQGKFGAEDEQTATECLAVDKVIGGASGGHCAGVFRSHEKIYRNVTFLPNGVETVTYSSDARKARELNSHVRMMTMMVRMGHKVHQHDPLFQYMFDARWKGKIQTQHSAIGQGVRVVQTSADECAVQLIHFHARAVSLFVTNGLDEFRCKHTLPACVHSG